MGYMHVVVVAVALLCAVLSVMHNNGNFSVSKNAKFSVSKNAQLDPFFYAVTCPSLYPTVITAILTASLTDSRIGASLMRLHFHDCFVQGCDGSILLNNTATIESEQDAFPNKNSIRGLDVVNNIKTAVEANCPDKVSCADILAVAADVAFFLGGGGYLSAIPLGRRDSLKANRTLANHNLPKASFTLEQLKGSFAAQGLNTIDLVALSGAHTFGRVHCRNFIDRLYNFSGTGNPDPTLDTAYLAELRMICPHNGDGNNLANLDLTTPNLFDSWYYYNLQIKKGLLQSDQELFSTRGADTIAIVNSFSSNPILFLNQFVVSMIKMGEIGVLTGNEGEIRKQCNFVNGKSFGLAGSVSEDSKDL